MFGCRFRLMRSTDTIDLRLSDTYQSAELAAADASDIIQQLLKDGWILLEYEITEH